MKLRTLVASSLAAVLVMSGLTLAGPVSTASAADTRLFDPGNIISDALFFDGSAMTGSAVQNFLNLSVTSCRSGYTCLKDYRQNTQDRAAQPGRCDAYAGRANESAADIITRVGVACGLSQKAILVLLEKEQGLVTDTWPVDRQYRAATGYACPDTAACDSTYYGFFNQVYSAALQFKRYAATPSGWNHVAGRTNFVRFHPNAACGSSAVFIQNQATAGLYNYTPYQPNAASLANQYGTGDGCSSYGNRNFWRMYTDWFGSTTTSSLVRTESNSSVYLTSGTVKYPVTSLPILSALAPLGTVSFVSQSYLDRFTTAQPVGRSIRSPEGTIYFFDSGIKLPYTSCAQAVDYGSSCSSTGFVQLTAAQAASFVTGPALGPVLGTVEGSRYLIRGGTRSEILDDRSQAEAGLPAGFNVLTEGAVSALPLAAPTVRDSVFVKQRSASSAFLVSGGKKYSAASFAYGQFAGSLRADSLRLIADATVPFVGVVSATSQPGTTYVLTGTGKYTWTVPGITLGAVPAGPSVTDAYADLGALSVGSLIKSPANGTVYLVMPNDIRPISGWDAMLAIAGSSAPVIITLPADFISSLPVGPVALKSGALYRSPDNATVYLINGVTSRIPFSSFLYPSEAGFNEFAYTTAERLAAYPLEPSVLEFGLSCGADKYLAAGSAVHLIPVEAQPLYPISFVPFDSFACQNFKIGEPAGAFIRSAGGTIYQLDAGVKKPILSMARFAELSAGRTWLQVSDRLAGLIPTGPNA